ncbi:hypothetical protein APS67_006746 [Streptomyces sp. AVP053U2]|nr:hypothetical protein APS67_006746 [Streptomyces sp. AVP053U2]
MADARRRRGPHHRVPDRPRLGPGRPVRRRPRQPGRQRHPPRRLPARRGRLRRRLLRDLPARGPRHGPAAAPAPGDLLGGVRTRRHRPAEPARQRHRHLRRHHRPGLRDPGDDLPRRRRGPRQHRSRHQRHLRPGLLRPRPGGPGPHRGHRLLLLPGRPAPRRPVPAQRRELPRPRGRRHRAVDPDELLRVHPAGRPGRRRPVQGVRRRRRRHRLVRGRRHARPGAPVGRPPQRARGARRGPRFGHQPGRRLQRADRPQRPLPAARHPPGPGECGAHARRRGRRRGARHGHDPRRPDRGAGAARHLRPGPRPGASAAARLDQVEHRPHPGRRRCRGRHQDGARPASRCPAQDPPRRPALHARRLGGRRGTAPHRAHRVAGHGPTVARRCVVLRPQRHQRPRHPRTTRTGRGGPGAGPRTVRLAGPGAVADLGAVRGRPAGPDRPGDVLRRRVRPGRGLLPGRRSHRVRAPGGASRGHGCGG